MKVAIVQERLMSVGGSDKVAKAIFDVFPEADIYTLIAKKSVCEELGFDYSKINTSIIQRFPFGESKYRVYLPFMPFAIEQFDLNAYDVVISSSHTVAKGVLTREDQLHICYCHTPVRYAWDLYHEYMRNEDLSKGIKGLFSKYVLHRIRQWDVLSSFRVDYFVSNSNYVAKRIKKIYGREAETIYPNIDVNFFTLCTEKKDYYLASSRLVGYKKIDLVVEAFNRMPDKKLIVTGDGPELRKIMQIAKENVQIIGFQTLETLRVTMQKAKALVFAADEDFGMIPVEVQACGTPVIAFGRGGCLETVREGETGLFFYEQSVDAIIDAVNRFEKKSFDYKKIRDHAERFSEERFKKEIKEYVLDKYNNHKAR
jgi:glycosyltransferase involved in cell wall biosynthesis